MVTKYKVARLWLIFMSAGALGGVGSGLYFMWAGRFTPLALSVAFITYALLFLIRYGVGSYITLDGSQLTVRLPPLFWAKRVNLEHVIEVHDHMEVRLLLVLRDGREVKLPLGFLMAEDRAAVRRDLSALIPERPVM